MSDSLLPLFRPEALNSVRPRTYGQVILIRPLSFAVLTSASLLTAAIVAGFLIWGTYTPRITLSGQLAPTAGVSILFPSQAGIIIRKEVEVGDSVQAGQRLYTLSVDKDDKSSQSQLVEVRASTNGTAVETFGKLGQYFAPTSPLLAILPDDATLEARLLAPTRSVGILRPGAPVTLRYDAYPYQRFGHHKGILTSISRSATTFVSPGTGQGSEREPMHLIKVALPSQALMAYGTPHKLMAGMTVQADLLQETRRLYELILDRHPTADATPR